MVTAMIYVFHFSQKLCYHKNIQREHKQKPEHNIKKVEELTMKKTFFEKLSAMLTGYYKSFSMDF